MAGRTLCRFPPQRVGASNAFLHEALTKARAGEGIVLGFDFVIGLPSTYCRRASIRDFMEVLPKFERSDRWERFYEVASEESQISLHQPFYPRSCRTRGMVKQEHLLRQLNMTRPELLRSCERLPPTAGALFWTVGPKQVGKGAIAGWRELLVPAIGYPEVRIWPFSGRFWDLVQPGHVVIAETYPGGMYRLLGLQHVGTAGGGGKTHLEVRRNEARHLAAWAKRRGVDLSGELKREMENGFGRHGDDAFDAVVGLFGMLEVVLGHRCPYDPPKGPLTKVEGWMLGREPITSASPQYNEDGLASTRSP